jgi:hypothetical protein
VQKGDKFSMDPKTVEGIFRDGRVELAEIPRDVDEAKVLVTFLPQGAVILSGSGIDEGQAGSLRTRLSAFAEDWELPEMGAYDAL